MSICTAGGSADKFRTQVNHSEIDHFMQSQLHVCCNTSECESPHWCRLLLQTESCDRPLQKLLLYCTEMQEIILRSKRVNNVSPDKKKKNARANLSCITFSGTERHLDHLSKVHRLLERIMRRKIIILNGFWYSILIYQLVGFRM